MLWSEANVPPMRGRGTPQLVTLSRNDVYGTRSHFALSAIVTLPMPADVKLA